jgi:hypothetical protein
MVLFWSLARSTWRRQGSAIYYVDAIAELLVNNEARVFAIGGGDPPASLSTRLQQCVDISSAASHTSTQSDVVDVEILDRRFGVVSPVRRDWNLGLIRSAGPASSLHLIR